MMAFDRRCDALLEDVVGSTVLGVARDGGPHRLGRC